jgi:spore coat protein U-like protein
MRENIPFAKIKLIVFVTSRPLALPYHKIGLFPIHSQDAPGVRKKLRIMVHHTTLDRYAGHLVTKFIVRGNTTQMTRQPLKYRTLGIRHLVRKATISTLVAFAGLAMVAPAADATTTTSNMSVQLILVSNCVIGSVASMDFGSSIDLATALSTTANILVTCTSGTPYTVELSAGGGSGATTAARKMTSGGNTVTYSIYKESAHTNVFGTGGTEKVSATGNAAAQTYTAYGLVPIQATPPIGTYTDTVTVTVTY